jgi:hypothetical protein
MKAALLLHEKIINDDSSIVEMKVWSMAKSSAYPLGVKYSLYWVRDQKIIAGYDNHFPKGPHRHYGNKEETYEFVSVQKLLEDFKQDLRRLKP